MAQRARSINTYRVPDLGTAHARRGSAVGMGMLTIPLLAVAFAALSLWDGSPWSGVTGPDALRLALLGLAVVFAAYAARRELLLRRLSNQLGDERVLSAAYANRLRDLSAMDEVTRRVAAVLDLEEALPALLDETLAAFHAVAGSIMLFDGSGYLETVAARGNDRAEGARLKIGDSVAGHVALTREPLLLSGEASPERFRELVERDDAPETAMSVPLAHGDEVLGVLNLNSAPGRPFSQHDLQLLSLLAGHAALVVANAREFQKQRHDRRRLEEANRGRAELIETVDRDLRAPLRALRSSLATLARHPSLDPGAEELVEAMERSGRRIDSSARRLAGGARDEEERRVVPVTSDLPQIAQRVAADFEAEGRPVEISVASRAEVSGDPALVEQVLWALLDNAFTHGAPPVRVDVWAEHDHGVVAVSDGGPGLGPDERATLFMRPGAGGMGLGLSIVHSIVSSCSGRVWAEAADDGGARFRVTLPLARQAEPTHGEEMTA